jgi:hypothetical protein
MTDYPMKYRDALIGRMIAAGAKDVSDAEIERTLGPCVCGPALVQWAKSLRADGHLVVDDIFRRPMSL